MYSETKPQPEPCLNIYLNKQAECANTRLLITTTNESVMINQQQKKEITWHLQNYVASFPSQRQAANSLTDVSESTIIQVCNNRWDAISERMWMSIAKQIGVGNKSIEPVETLDFNTLILYYSIAKEEGATFAITGGAGFGKSFSGRWFAANNRSNNVYYIECAQYWNKKMFLSNILQTMGKEYAGMNVGELMETIIGELRKQPCPLIILDEIDKLSDPVLTFFITLYNDLNGMCGFVWTSTNNIQKRIRKGLSLNKTGYQEVFSRIGSRFIELHGTTPDEVRNICHANGITDAEDIARIVNEYNGDLRRVERNLLKHRVKSFKTKKAA